MTPMSHSNFSKGFSGGLTVRGLPVLNAYSGNVLWVHSAGSANGAGTFQRPYATLEQAINAADVGDTIMVKAGHAESIADATTLVFDKAGISIVGLGSGSRRPTFTFTTATTANIPVSAANVSIENILFVANFADIVSFITLTTAPEFLVNNCEFRDTSSILNALTCVTTTVTVNADGLTFTNNRVQSLATTAATTMIKVAGTMSRLTINDNYYVGAVLNNTAALLAHGALNVTNLEMARNRVFRPNTDTATGGILITTSATANTGMVYDNYIACLDAAAVILVTAGCDYGMFNNMVIGEVDTSGLLLPAVFNNA